MKKQLFLMSALALTALTSCGGKGGGIKVGLICLHDTASTYDKNFIDAFNASCEEAKKAGRISEYKVVTDVAEDGSACADAADRFINQGYSVIFSDSFGHDRSMHEVAKDNPNVFFSSATGIEAYNSGLDNFHNAFASIHEGRFLAGVAGGEYLIKVKQKKAGDEIKLGYVGAYPYAEVVSGFTAWYLGVKYAFDQLQNGGGDNVTMKVIYTNSWYSETDEAQAAETLINAGYKDLVSQHADSMGAPNTCAKYNVPNISYNMNTAEMSASCAGTYIAHSRINWKPYYDAVLKTAVGSKIKGEDEHNNWTGHLSGENPSVEYNVSDLVPADGKEFVNETANKLKDGSLQVFDTSTFTAEHILDHYEEGCPSKPETGDYTLDANNHLTKLKCDVEGDYTRNTDIVVSGKVGSYVAESTNRSAPSFDIIIDKIDAPDFPKPIE